MKKDQASAKKCVVFASSVNHPRFNKLAYNVGKMLALHGYVTITGGGLGLMDQVNRGAFESSGESWGILIKKANQQSGKYFTKSELYLTFSQRHNRLLSLGDYYIVLPGGLGTLLEALDITQRKRFGEIPCDKPLVFVGNIFADFIDNTIPKLKNEGFVDGEACNKMYQVTDELELLELISQTN